MLDSFLSDRRDRPINRSRQTLTRDADCNSMCVINKICNKYLNIVDEIGKTKLTRMRI